MAQFFTNFSEYTTGQAPADWTARWVTANVTYTVEADAGATGGKVLRSVVTSVARHALSWDDVGTPGATEILIKFRLSALTEAGFVNGAVLRGSGIATTENGYMSAGQPLAAAADRLYIREYTAGTSSDTSAQLTGTAFSINTWYWIRFRANGTSLESAVWADGESEVVPITTLTDATTSSGWAGIFTQQIATHDYDIFSVGTNGDVAPSVAPTGGKGSGGKGKGGNTPGPGEPPKKPLRTSLSKSWKWDRGWR